jgi:hypothetical protein
VLASKLATFRAAWLQKRQRSRDVSLEMRWLGATMAPTRWAQSGSGLRCYAYGSLHAMPFAMCSESKNGVSID